MKIAIVGAGLIGSAAARHLAKAGHSVTLIGPAEVTGDWSAHAGNFASHYDEGRITRRNDRRPFFARASDAAIRRYPEIKAESGMDFFTETGALLAGSAAFVAQVAEARQGLDFPFEALDPENLAQRFPYFALPQGFSADYEATGAGHISPRRLVAAQQEAARRHGATRLTEEATSIAEGRVQTHSTTIEADEVIVAAGGWTDALLGRQTLDVYARTVAFHEIAPAEAERLKTMPALVMESPDDIYILPPVRYPDGKLWLKLGGDPTDDLLAGESAINDWFRSGGNAERADYLTGRILEIVPRLAFESRHYKPCVTTWSHDGIPEIRRLAPGLIIAAAGNGAGAKCSDELGRMAANIAISEKEISA